MINSKRFEDSMDWLIRLPSPDRSIEGGYYKGNLSSDPNPTNHGITQKTYDRVRINLHLPKLNVKDLTIAVAMDIYYHEYWTIAQCYLLPEPIDIIVFDTAVNCGVGRAKAILLKDHNPIKYLDNRLAYYKEICIKHPNYLPNIKGWTNRLNKLRTLCHLL